MCVHWLHYRKQVRRRQRSKTDDKIERKECFHQNWTASKAREPVAWFMNVWISCLQAEVVVDHCLGHMTVTLAEPRGGCQAPLWARESSTLFGAVRKRWAAPRWLKVGQVALREMDEGKTLSGVFKLIIAPRTVLEKELKFFHVMK